LEYFNVIFNFVKFSVRRSIIHYEPDQMIQRYDLSALDTSVVIDQLTPESGYGLLLSAKTQKGRGEAYNITVITKPIAGNGVCVCGFLFRCLYAYRNT